jgi:cation:H+ antiporter
MPVSADQVSLVADFSLFLLAAAASLGASGILVVRLERIAKRYGLTETALGLLAALAADAPEISSSVAALVHHDQGISVGIVLGSNLFNLAALLGLAAVVASPLLLGRPLTVLEGAPATALAVFGACMVAGWISPVLALVAVLAVVVPYASVVIIGPHRLRRRFSFGRTIEVALEAEAADVDQLVHVASATGADLWAALLAVVGVVAASTVMEGSAVRLGTHFHLSALVVGGLVLAAVTSIPNVVAALYLSRRRRAAALVSEASNSNSLNVLFGLAIPAVVLRSHAPSSVMIGLFYVGLTVFAYAGIWFARGMRRSVGFSLLVGYAVFVVLAVVR